MLQVSKLLRSKFYQQIIGPELAALSACGQGRLMNLYVRLVVQMGAKLQQAVCS